MALRCRIGLGADKCSLASQCQEYRRLYLIAPEKPWIAWMVSSFAKNSALLSKARKYRHIASMFVDEIVVDVWDGLRDRDRGRGVDPNLRLAGSPRP